MQLLRSAWIRVGLHLFDVHCCSTVRSPGRVVPANGRFWTEFSVAIGYAAWQ